MRSYFTAVRFNYVIADGQSQTGSLPGWLRSKEWLKDLVHQLRRNTVPIVFNGNQEMAILSPGSYRNDGFIARREYECKEILLKIRLLQTI